jgi:hypothetical protein
MSVTLTADMRAVIQSGPPLLCRYRVGGRHAECVAKGNHPCLG